MKEKKAERNRKHLPAAGECCLVGTCRGAHSCPRSATNGPGRAPRPLPCRKMHTVSSQAADSQCPTRAASLPQETEGRSHRRAAYVDGTGSAEGEPERWPSAREGRWEAGAQSRCGAARGWRGRGQALGGGGDLRGSSCPASAGARAPLKVDNPPAGDTSGTQSQRRPRPTLVVALLIQTTVPAPAASGRRRRSLRSGPPPPSPTARVAPSPAASPESPSRGSAR